MGNRRSVEKALAHVGARAIVSGDPERLRDADGLVVPGVGAFPRAMERLRELGLDELLRERVAAGTPVLGICLGLQLAFEHSSELGGADGPGDRRRRGARPARRRAEAAAHRLERGALCETGVARWSPTCRANAPSTTCTRSRPSLRASRTCSAPPTYGAPFVTAVEKGSFYGVQFHAEKSSAAGLRLLANFARICADALAPSHAGAPGADAAEPVNLYPAIDILGGNAVRLVKGDFDAKKVYDEDPRVGGAGVQARRGAASCTSSTSTAPKRARRRTSCALRRDRRASSACRCSTAAACARARRSTRRSRRAPRA